MMISDYEKIECKKEGLRKGGISARGGKYQKLIYSPHDQGYQSARKAKIGWEMYFFRGETVFLPCLAQDKTIR